MHLAYDDILRRVPQRPLWWLDGVPRYDPFVPQAAGATEIALVHTECQECGTRYDVAVRPRWPLFRRLRDIMAQTNSLEIGDPPNACQALGARCGAGATMNSDEIAVLEFWCRPSFMSDWKRDKSMEIPLVDARLPKD